MDRLSLLIFTFALSFAVFVVFPRLVGEALGPYPIPATDTGAPSTPEPPGSRNVEALSQPPRFLAGELLGLFASPVLIPQYWLLYRRWRTPRPTPGEELLFVALAGLWASGQGMYLAANSIERLLEGRATDIHALTHFYADVLSRYVWHIGIAGLSTLILVRAWRYSPPPTRPGLWIWISAALYGFTFFTTIIEGGTVPLGLPFALAIVVAGLVWGRKQLTSNPLLAFLVLAHLLATILFVGWGVYWGGFPEFRALGSDQRLFTGGA